MSALDTYLALLAGAEDRAVPRTRFRHRHLAADPMVVVAYRLAGDPAAPVVFGYGTDPGRPTWVACAEPRNRELRFAAINAFAADLCAYVESFAADRETVAAAGRRTATADTATAETEEAERQVCSGAPQILVPNRATAEYLALLGRSVRYLDRPDAAVEVPAHTPRAGAHLAWLAEQGQRPGSSLLLAATETLCRHFATGQSALEDENLPTLLAWIDPPYDGALAGAARAEATVPPMGPVSDPLWDNRVLAPAIARFGARHADEEGRRQESDRIRDLLAGVLSTAWAHTWQAHRILADLAAAASVPDRWTSDRWAYTGHVDRLAGTEPAAIVVRDPAIRAAMTLNRREEAQAVLDAAEAFDDPLVLAGCAADGQVVAGQVVEVDSETVVAPGGGRRPARRPVYVLALERPCPFPPDTEVTWTGRPGAFRAVVTAVADGTVRLRQTTGMRGVCPAEGEEAAFTTLMPGEFRPSAWPEEVPWTHRPPDAGASGASGAGDAGGPEAGPDRDPGPAEPLGGW